MVDTFFSLHCPGIEEPVYISEVVDRAMNPNFRFFQLLTSGPAVTRQDECTVNVWAKTESAAEYSLLVDIGVHLRSLQYIGKSLDNCRHPLPENCIIFHMIDGIYTSFTDLPSDDPPPNYGLLKSDGKSGVRSTSSYDALMRLANLDDCIQDALTTRVALKAQMNSILQEHEFAFKTFDERSQAEEALASTQRSAGAESKQLRQAMRRRDELREGLRARREAIKYGRISQDRTSSHLTAAKGKIPECHTVHGKYLDDTAGQIRRICEDICRIYPIEPIPDKNFAFTICGLPLPSSKSLENTDANTVAAAIGYAAHIIYLLSFYLSMPIPYPVKYYSSRSVINDPISSKMAVRTYPLYPTGAQFKFDYGVFLLNQNIQYMMSQKGLQAIDVRQTLPNLKYLLYYLTAGVGELPARKAGGIRGLLVGRGPGSVSRRDSEESVLSGSGIIGQGKILGKVQGSNGKAKA